METIELRLVEGVAVSLGGGDLDRHFPFLPGVERTEAADGARDGGDSPREKAGGKCGKVPSPSFDLRASSIDLAALATLTWVSGLENSGGGGKQSLSGAWAT